MMNNDSERKKFAVAFREKYSPYANYSDWDICEHTGRREFEGWLLARAALVAPQQEPVAYRVEWSDIGEGIAFSFFYAENAKADMESAVSYGLTIPRPATATPLYAAPPSVAPLTDDQIMDIAVPFHDVGGVKFDEVAFAREIIVQARGEK